MKSIGPFVKPRVKKKNHSPEKVLGRGIKGPPVLGVKGGSCYSIDWE